MDPCAYVTSNHVKDAKSGSMDRKTAQKLYPRHPSTNLAVQISSSSSSFTQPLSISHISQLHYQMVGKLFVAPWLPIL